MKDSTHMTRAELHEYLVEYGRLLSEDLKADPTLRVRLLLRHQEDAEFIKKHIEPAGNVIYTLIKVTATNV